MDQYEGNTRTQRSGCGFFWGPFRPLFGGHSLFEAATSAIFPTVFVVIYRTIFTIYLLSTYIYFQIEDSGAMIQFTNWSHLGLSISFAILTAVSLNFLFSPSSQQSTQPSRIAFIAILIFQLFASAALFLDVIYWALLYDSETTSADFSNLTRHAFNLVCVLLDIFLSLRMNFKLMYGLIFLLYVVIYLVFLWVRFAITDEFVYSIYDYRDKSAGTTVLYYFGTVLWCLVAGLITILLSRFNRLPCIPGRYSRSNLASSIDDTSSKQTQRTADEAVWLVNCGVFLIYPKDVDVFALCFYPIRARLMRWILVLHYDRSHFAGLYTCAS